MGIKNTDLPKTETSATAIAAATPSAPAVPKPKRPRKRKWERPMSDSTARTIELLRLRAGDDAARDQRDELARQKAFGEGTNDVIDTLDDDARLDFFSRHYLVASGPNRAKILKHPGCPSEDEILAYIDCDLTHLLAEYAVARGPVARRDALAIVAGYVSSLKRPPLGGRFLASSGDESPSSPSQSAKADRAR